MDIYLKLNKMRYFSDVERLAKLSQKENYLLFRDQVKNNPSLVGNLLGTQK